MLAPRHSGRAYLSYFCGLMYKHPSWFLKKARVVMDNMTTQPKTPRSPV